MAALVPPIDRDRSAARIARDIELLAGRNFTRSDDAIVRYAYTPEYRRTVEYFRDELKSIGFDVFEDPVGTLIARNRPTGEPVFGVGSHCDSNRNGGRYDGTMGVVTALEVCRLNEELQLGLPLQLISFLEEEGSGFGQMLLGSRIMLQRVSEQELQESFRSVDDGRSFWEHAEDAGYEPARWRESIHALDDLTGWIEMHIEQARVLQDTENRIGIVDAIAGYVHADVLVHGRGDHAGATPMDLRLDPTLVLAETALELERLATEAGHGTVGTIGEIDVDPGLINAIASSRAILARHPRPRRRRLPWCGRRDRGVRGRAPRGGVAWSAEIATRQTLAVTPLDAAIVAALEVAARSERESRSVACTRERPTTRCASPTAFRVRWCSCRARRGSATTRTRRPIPPTQRSRPRSSSAR